MSLLREATGAPKGSAAWFVGVVREFAAARTLRSFGSERARSAGRLSALLTLLLLGGFCARTVPASAYPEPPQGLFRGLFVAVQSARLYPDGKTFADAVPKAAPAQILAQYERTQPHDAHELMRFVEENFSLPVLPAPVVAAKQTSVTEHIDTLWAQLTRTTTTVPPYSSLLPLPHPYVVPGGRFREIYYWDSYFTMLGLDESGRHDLVRNMVEDFAHLIDFYGHVPNGTRTYYLSRSQPPFFFAMVWLLGKQGSAEPLGRYLPQLKREYAFWMAGRERLSPGKAYRRVVALPDGSILNRYWDDRDTPRDESYREDVTLAGATERPPSQVFRDIRAAAESGWDFSSRWFADAHTRATIDTTKIVPVDLNSLLYGLEKAIEAGCRQQGDSACALQFRRHAAARQRAIDRYLWDKARGVYFDYRWSQRAPVTRLSAATLYPLFVSLATPEQARAVALATRAQLLAPGGVVTTAAVTGEQWDSPNGWAPLQWIAIDGLRRYGEEGLAAMIACRWMGNVEDVYRRSGKLVEKYDVVNLGRPGGGGEYPTQDGFGWTNGVLRKLIAFYPTFANGTPASGCPAEKFQ
jgi:alpha,alpha-trehalase